MRPCCLSLCTCLSKKIWVRAAGDWQVHRMGFVGGEFRWFVSCFASSVAVSIFFFMLCAINGGKALKRQSILYSRWALSNLAQQQGSKPFYFLPQTYYTLLCTFWFQWLYWSLMNSAFFFLYLGHWCKIFTLYGTAIKARGVWARRPGVKVREVVCVILHLSCYLCIPSLLCLFPLPERPSLFVMTAESVFIEQSGGAV